MPRNDALFKHFEILCKNSLNSRARGNVCTFRHLVANQMISTSRKKTLCSPKIFALRTAEIGKVKNDFSKIAKDICWKCQQCLELKKFFCAQCGALQYPREDINYFELFSMAQTFDINSEDLSKKFKNLQMTFHPDKFANNSKEELDISEIYSRLINKAYATLKNPLSRGFYILDLQKLPADSNTPIEQEFLMSMMEKNEELESIESDYSALSKLLETNHENINKQLQLVSNNLHLNEWSEAKINLQKLNYYYNLESKMKEKMLQMKTATAK